MESSGYVPNLDVGFLFGKSWALFKQHLGLVVGVFLVYSVLTGAMSSLVGRDTATGKLLQIVEFLIQGPLLAGTYYVMLQLVRGQPTEFREMFEGFNEFGRAFGVYVLYVVLVGFGILLLIVPGIIVAVGLMPAMYLVLDADRDVLKTLKRAWAMTSGYRARLFIVFLALLGVNILGLLLLIVGVIFSGAFSFVVGAAMYNELARRVASGQ